MSGSEGVCQPGGAGQAGEEPIRGKYYYHLTNQRQVLCSQVEGWLSGPEWVCQPGGAGQAGEEVDGGDDGGQLTAQPGNQRRLCSLGGVTTGQGGHTTTLNVSQWSESQEQMALQVTCKKYDIPPVRLRLPTAQPRPGGHDGAGAGVVSPQLHPWPHPRC